MKLVEGRPLVMKMLFGSHLYGLDTPESDKDYKGILMPTRTDILMGNTDFHISKSTGTDDSKNSADDVDTEYFSLHRFIKLAAKGETVAIDMLHAEPDMVVDFNKDYLHLWRHLQLLRPFFYTKSMSAYIGYVRKQAAKYGVKGSRIAALELAITKLSNSAAAFGFDSPISHAKAFLPVNEHAQFVEQTHEKHGTQNFYEICGRKFQMTNRFDYTIENMTKILDGYGERAKLARDNNGIDWKAISHALRAGYQARAIFKNYNFSYPLAETAFLKQVKAGELDFVTEVQPVLEKLVDEVEELAAKSDFPEKCDTTEIYRFMREEHMKVFM